MNRDTFDKFFEKKYRGPGHRDLAIFFGELRLRFFNHNKSYRYIGRDSEKYARLFAGKILKSVKQLEFIPDSELNNRHIRYLTPE